MKLQKSLHTPEPQSFPENPSPLDDETLAIDSGELDAKRRPSPWKSIARKKTTQNPTPNSQPPMQRKKRTPPPNKMRVLQHNCQKKPEYIYSLLETATTMNFDIVLIQEPPMGLRGKNISSGTFTFHKPEPDPLFNDRPARVWLAVNKTAEREKYVLEERNDLSANPDIQIFDFYEKIWRKEKTEEDKQRKEEKEKKKKTNKKPGHRRWKTQEKKRKHAAEETVKARERMKEKTLIAKNSEDEHVPQDKDKKHKTKKEKSRRRKDERNKEERRDDEENGDDTDSGESQESDVRGEKHVRGAV
jgi:hypothetical protein